MAVHVKLVSCDALKTDDMRRAMAKLASTLMQNPEWQFEPYTASERSTYEWVIDKNNDFRIIFNEKHPTLMHFWHRYGDDVALAALSGWFAFRIGASVASVVSAE